MPLLYALRDELGLHGLHFGCGLAQCGACTVHYYGEPLRCCVMPISAVAGAEVVTLEGLGTPEKPHPLQQAFIDEQAVQCGYCINGMIMQAAALLADEPNARPRTRSGRRSRATCASCGTHVRIVRGRDARGREEWHEPGSRCPTFRLSRRAFLEGRRRARGHLRRLAPTLVDAQNAAGASAKSVAPDEVGGFLAIDAKGMVTRLLRQGGARHRRAHRDDADRGGRAVGADRLGSRRSRATPRSRPTRAPTYGSLSIQDGGMQIRQAAATAREALLDQAAGQARRRPRLSSS